MSDNETAWVGVMITSAGFAFGLYQYRINSFNAARARSREQAIKAADELENLFKDQDVEIAMRIIDYEAIDIALPNTNAGTSPTYVKINRVDLKSALDHHSDRAPPGKQYNVEKGEMFKPVELQIRYIFDKFFVRLERIENLIRNGVIAKADFQDLFSYWLELIGEIPKAQDQINHFGDGRREKLWRYIRLYKFDCVVRLFQIFGRAAPVGIPPEQAFVARPASEAETCQKTSP
jgi:hypothetical protein